MPAQLIDGRKIADAIRATVARDVKRVKTTPGLAVVLVGEEPASALYVHLKEKAAHAAGIHFECRRLPENIDQETLLVQIEHLNARDDIHGILVQLPLPKHLETTAVVSAIRPEKDVDGFHPNNIRAFLSGTPRITPGLPMGIMKLLESTGEALQGKRAVILANSRTFAGPIRYMLRAAGIRSRMVTKRILNAVSPITTEADILITALGIPDIVKPVHVKEGAIVIDVGTTQTDEGIRGDVHLDVMKKAAWLTPVPGGVGPVTVAMLLHNVLEAYRLQNH